MDFYPAEFADVKNFVKLHEGECLLLYYIVGSDVHNLSSQIYKDSIVDHLQHLNQNFPCLVSSNTELNTFLKTALNSATEIKEPAQMPTQSFGILFKCNTVDVLNVRRVVERERFWFNPVENGQVSYDLHIQQSNGPDKVVLKKTISKHDIGELKRRGARLYFTLRPVARSSPTQPVMMSMGWCDGHYFQEEVLRINFGQLPVEE